MTDCYEARDNLPRHREIKLPLEIKPEQVKASFRDGILEVLAQAGGGERAEGDGGVERATGNL